MTSKCKSFHWDLFYIGFNRLKPGLISWNVSGASPHDKLMHHINNLKLNDCQFSMFPFKCASTVQKKKSNVSKSWKCYYTMTWRNMVAKSSKFAYKNRQHAQSNLNFNKLLFWSKSHTESLYLNVQSSRK